MKKFFLVLFIILDLALMAAAGLFLWKRLQGLSLVQVKPVSSAARVVTSSATASGGLITPTTGLDAAADGAMRKILFSYPNSKARQVAIRADFTGWKAEAMNRNDKGVWTYQATLAPGEYAYCYTVDDKTFKDPANKKTKQIGRTFVSAITVEAK